MKTAVSSRRSIPLLCNPQKSNIRRERSMKQLQGVGASSGIAFGPIHFYRHEQQLISRRHVESTEAEMERFEEARQKTIEQLGELYEKALTQVGEQGAQVFEIHQMMLEDEDYLDSISNIITTQSVNSEYAVAVTSENFSKMFSEMDDPYMQGRAADIKDISERLLKVLSGQSADGMEFDSPVVLAADDLAPSETVQLDKTKILAFLTAGGSSNSHTAILARTMGIPAVVGLGDQLSGDLNGKQVVVDGKKGLAIIEPDEATRTDYEKKQQELAEKKRLQAQLKGRPGETKDGKRILTYANIGNPSDVGAALMNDAEGIGLFRSEFIYLAGQDYPSESDQLAAYKSVVENMAGKRVIFRTLDIGADKQADYFNLPHEENPAMGMRAIRICLTRTEVFRTQLRALYRASAYGKVAIMFPMITSVWELKEAKKLAEQVKAELRTEGIPFDEEIELGIMIETPAAVMVSRQLAKEVDFFSVGTNDLTQYTLAVDRQNQSLGRFYDAHHPAVLEMIRQTVKNAHEFGAWVGICGELAADLSLTETFLALDVDELSVVPSAVLPLREKICSLTCENREKILAELAENC